MRKPCKSSFGGNFSTQWNSRCLFTTFNEIIKSLFACGGCFLSLPPKPKSSSSRVKGNFPPYRVAAALFFLHNLWSRYQFLFHVITLVKCMLVKLIFIFYSPRHFTLPPSYHHYIKAHRCWFSASFSDTSTSSWSFFFFRSQSIKKCFDMSVNSKKKNFLPALFQWNFSHKKSSWKQI